MFGTLFEFVGLWLLPELNLRLLIRPETLNPQPYKPDPQTLNPKPETLNPEPRLVAEYAGVGLDLSGPFGTNPKKFLPGYLGGQDRDHNRNSRKSLTYKHTYVRTYMYIYTYIQKHTSYKPIKTTVYIPPSMRACMHTLNH